MVNKAYTELIKQYLLYLKIKINADRIC